MSVARRGLEVALSRVPSDPEERRYARLGLAWMGFSLLTSVSAGVYFVTSDQWGPLGWAFGNLGLTSALTFYGVQTGRLVTSTSALIGTHLVAILIAAWWEPTASTSILVGLLTMFAVLGVALLGPGHGGRWAWAASLEAPVVAAQVRGEWESSDVVLGVVCLTAASLALILETARKSLALKHEERDIELRRAFQRADAASQAKDQFVAMISHELRTPLNGILGVQELLLQTKLGPDQEALVNASFQSAQDLLLVVNDLLAFRRPESETIALQPARFNLREGLRGFMGTFRESASLRGLSLELDLSADLPVEVLIDEARLKQLIAHLVRNAIKFSENGTIHVSVHHEEDDAGAIDLRVTVRDPGIGMTQAVVAQIFEPFFQADTSRTRRFGGAGLGLTVARRVVEALNGKLEVRSRPGYGSTFEFRVPVSKPPPSETPSAQVGNDEPSFLGRTFRVLVVDDHPINRMVARSILERAGHEVVLAENGQNAVAMLSTATGFDIVFMDCQMPEMDGYAATREIRKLDGDTCRIPVVAVTANSEEGDILRCLACGMDGHIAKPISQDRLLQALDRYIGI